jgi:hypothetical protein
MLFEILPALLRLSYPCRNIVEGLVITDEEHKLGVGMIPDQGM